MSLRTPGKVPKMAKKANVQKCFICRKNHARAMDSMQASLEAEQHAKAEAVRMKKKIEGDINELEIALDHSNKANSEAQKVVVVYCLRFLSTWLTYNPPGHQAIPGSAEGCQHSLRGGAEESAGGCREGFPG